MSLELAIRLTEILMGFAFIQQSLEHLTSVTNERRLFITRILLSLLLIIGFQTAWITLLLLLLSLAILQHFQGPYNGGSDRMSLLILCSLSLVHLAPAVGKKWPLAIFHYN